MYVVSISAEVGSALQWKVKQKYPPCWCQPTITIFFTSLFFFLNLKKLQISTFPALFEALNSHLWLIATVQNSTGIDHFHRCFPGGSVVKNLSTNVGDVGSIPGSGRSSGIVMANPLLYSCLENSMEEEPGRLQSMGSQRVRYH